mgnify:CR=1 FL=1
MRYELINDASIFHFGSVSMTAEPSRSATIKAVSYAKKKGIAISYDPNLRIPLWKSLDEAREVIMVGMKYADFLKISEEELVFLTGESNLEKGSFLLYDKYGIGLIFVTLGSKGSFCRMGSHIAHSYTYDVKTIDTTGAGDAFLGGILYKILGEGCRISELRPANISSFMDFANAAGSLTTLKKGAITALPYLEDIKKCIETVPKLVKR